MLIAGHDQRSGRHGGRARFRRLAPAHGLRPDDKRGAFDVAILDMNLAASGSEPLADLLDAAGAPFIFSTGYGATANCWPNAPSSPSRTKSRNCRTR